jgi:hypothetical protein
MLEKDPKVRPNVKELLRNPVFDPNYNFVPRTSSISKKETDSYSEKQIDE